MAQPSREDLVLLDPEGTFRHRLAADRDAICRVLASGDSPDLQVIIHRLAGAAGTFGYAQIGEIALRIDEMDTGGASRAEAHRLLAALDRALGEKSA